jgi:hypothetical protein
MATPVALFRCAVIPFMTPSPKRLIMQWVSTSISTMDLADGKGLVEAGHNQPLMPDIVNAFIRLC